MMPTTYCLEHKRLEPFVELEELPIPDEGALEYAVYNARQVKVVLGCGATKNLVSQRPYAPETALD